MPETIRLTGKDGRIAAATTEAAGAGGFIARETALHLEELTGLPHEPPRRVSSAGEARDAALLLEVDPALGREAFDCAEEDGRARVRGGDARGMYYGLMAFFESLGFRWCAPGEAGTVVPRPDLVALPRGWRARGRPALPWRGLHICGAGQTRDGRHMPHFDHDTALWMVRNRMNFKPIHNEQYDEVFPLLDDLMLTPLAFGHSYSRWIPRAEFAAHPEYFALVAGRRLAEGQLCVSNPALQDELVRRIVAYADAHPNLPVISLAPNDGYKWCRCPACAAMDSPEDSARDELHRRHHHFTVEIARRVRELRPGRFVSSISYSNYLDPAPDAPHEPGLAISMCITRAQNRPLDDGASPSNRLCLERLERWLDKAGAVFWSAYFLSYGGTFPRSCEGQTVRTFRELARRGVAGMKSEVTPGRYDRWRSAEFFMYLVARAMYDADLDPEALRADFCRRYYGAAAPHCEAYLRLNSLCVERYAGELKDVDATTLPDLYTDGEVQALLAHMDRARDMAEREGGYAPRRVAPLLAQAREIADSRREVVLSRAEAAPLQARHLLHPPAFGDFDRFDWTPQRRRSNRLPYPHPNRFAVAWNDEALWLLFRLGEPDVDASRREGRPTPGAGVWGASNVDCFLSPKPESGVYYQVAANIHGAVYGARCRGREWDSAWPLGVTAAVQCLPDRWELILRVPFSGMDAFAPRPGARLRLAVNRGQMCLSPSTLGGWPDGGSWHRIETMGETMLTP